MKKILFLSALYCSIMSASAFAKEGPSISIESSKMNIDQSFANVTYLGSNDKTLPTLGYGYQFEFEDLCTTIIISFKFPFNFSKNQIS